MTVTLVTKTLAKFHQRATYGAVAGLLGKTPRSVMQGYPKDWQHSWVVNSSNGKPSKYPPPKVDPNLTERSDILRSPEDLAAWLDNPG